MKNNKVIKFQNIAIQKVLNGISITEKLIQEFEVKKLNNFSEKNKQFLEKLNKLPKDKQTEIRKKLAVMKKIHELAEKHRKKNNDVK